MHNVKLLINGKLYSDWQNVRVNTSIESAARTFSLQVFESIPKAPNAASISNGDACQVFIDEHLLITGYCDTTNISYDASNHSVSVSGRCKTADLVDCSPDLEFNEWNDRSLSQIATDICKTYGVNVVEKANTGANFKTFRIEQGERCIETIERLCRHRGVLRTSDEYGNLVFVNAGVETIKTPLISGVNVKSAQSQRSSVDLFSKYIIKGQNTGTDINFGKETSEPVGTAIDSNIRKRVTVIVAEDVGNNMSLSDRAIWEANVRRSRSEKYTVKVVGWTHKDGLWSVNSLVKYQDSILGVNDTFLIGEASYVLDENSGFITELTLVPKGSFELLPIPEKNDTGGLF